MMQSEFEKLLGTQVSTEDYAYIEQAYNNPICSDIYGKEQIVSLYKLGGMALMKALAPAGAANIELHNVILRINAKENDALRVIQEGATKDRLDLIKAFEDKFGAITNTKMPKLS